MSTKSEPGMGIVKRPGPSRPEPAPDEAKGQEGGQPAEPGTAGGQSAEPLQMGVVKRKRTRTPSSPRVVSIGRDPDDDLEDAASAWGLHLEQRRDLLTPAPKPAEPAPASVAPRRRFGVVAAMGAVLVLGALAYPVLSGDLSRPWLSGAGLGLGLGLMWWGTRLRWP